MTMKKLMIRLINWYQRVTINSTPTCRYTPTCSHYAKEAYEERNFFVASFLTLWRIIRCNPLSKGGYDPVPIKNHKSKHPMHYLTITLHADDGLHYQLSDFSGQKIILYVYIKDHALECTMESKDFTFYREDFESKGYKIIGISQDSVESHQNFIEKQMISNLLLSDPDLKLISAFGALKDNKVIRSTFVLNQDGTILKTYKNVSAEGHVERLLSEL